MKMSGNIDQILTQRLFQRVVCHTKQRTNMFSIVNRSPRL